MARKIIAIVLVTSLCVQPVLVPLAFAQRDSGTVSISDLSHLLGPEPVLAPLPFRQGQRLANLGDVIAQKSFTQEDEMSIMSSQIAQGILALTNSKTGIAPSHVGQASMQKIAFLYDKAVDALVLKAAGRNVEARAVLDFFSQKLQVPIAEVRRYADANGVYGMLKLVPSVDDPRAVGFVNAFDITSSAQEGEATLEYWTTPGPLAFVIMAFLYVDREKYREDAIKLGETLLVMQRENGGISDGDRGPANVHTEPHMDTFSAFLQLYVVTGDQKWKDAAERAWGWFEKNVYQPQSDTIYQGIRGVTPSEIFATDTYSWTMAGPAGDRLPLKVLEGLTDRMLRQGISRVTVDLPDGNTKTLTLIDFADVKDPRITTDRGGFHPMGSVEWIGGVILALQKNAVRFWQAGDAENRQKAKFYKALAESFTAEAIKSFYKINGIKGVLAFYATGQWISTGHGWNTPYFYVKDKEGNAVITGGSTIGAWTILPMKRQNPFQLDDRYGDVYDVIGLEASDQEGAKDYINGIVREKSFVEAVPTEIVDGAGDSPEMWRYNQQMFLAFAAGNYYAAVMWAEKSVKDPAWAAAAREQNLRKEREVGGLVDYPWGTAPETVKDTQRAIARYSLLNEMGAAVWGLAVSHYRLGNEMEAKAWIRSLIESFPLHQIYAPNGPGYWNALVSWETNPGGTALDDEMGRLYQDVLKEMGRTSALPIIVPVKK
ncbi:MAG: AGE family epimerase/isomerase [Candidatus Omnitrophica bacterium]|nr:AGE family epimerase/isomerase [Candidatus Omnitrophota bacterium]